MERWNDEKLVFATPMWPQRGVDKEHRKQFDMEPNSVCGFKVLRRSVEKTEVLLVFLPSLIRDPHLFWTC